MSRNWGAMTHAHHLVADGTSSAVVMVDAFGEPLRPPPPRVAPGHKRKNPGGPRQNPPPARARRAEAGTEPAVVVERITVPTSTSTAPLITISNLAGWVGVSAAERSNVDAEIIATNSEFIAVFETQPGDGDAPLGIVCGPVDILPKSVRKVVAARTTSAEIIINRRKMKFKGRMKETDFLEARYLGSHAGGVPTRLVRVAVTGPMRGRTMTAAMVLVLCARVRFLQAGVAAPGKSPVEYQFCVDDTMHPSEHNFNAGRPCYDEGSVFAFGAARTPTRECALPYCGGVCAGGLHKQEHQMACRPTVRARHAGHPGDHCRSAYTARAFANARAPCCAVLGPRRQWCGSPLGWWHDAPLSRVRAVCWPARLAAVGDLARAVLLRPCPT